MANGSKRRTSQSVAIGLLSNVALKITTLSTQEGSEIGLSIQIIEIERGKWPRPASLQFTIAGVVRTTAPWRKFCASDVVAAKE